MYSSYNDILKIKKAKELYDLVNDENRAYDDIDLSDADDLCRIRIDEAISDSDAEIDAYLTNRYKLPLSESSILIKTISVSLTIEKLFFRRMSDEMPEAIMNDAKNKRQLLKNISTGIVGLGLEATDSKQASGTYLTDKVSTDKVFTKTKLDRY